MTPNGFPSSSPSLIAPFVVAPRTCLQPDELELHYIAQYPSGLYSDTLRNEDGFMNPKGHRGKSRVPMRVMAVILAAMCGALLNCAGAWIVHHEHMNYSLPAPISTAAETASALGPVLWGAGMLLAVPLAIASQRHLRSFWKVASIEVLAYLALICCLGSVNSLAVFRFLGATVSLWVVAIIWAVISSDLSLGNSGITAKPDVLPGGNRSEGG